MEQKKRQWFQLVSKAYGQTPHVFKDTAELGQEKAECSEHGKDGFVCGVGKSADHVVLVEFWGFLCSTFSPPYNGAGNETARDARQNAITEGKGKSGKSAGDLRGHLAAAVSRFLMWENVKELIKDAAAQTSFRQMTHSHGYVVACDLFGAASDLEMHRARAWGIAMRLHQANVDVVEGQKIVGNMIKTARHFI